MEGSITPEASFSDHEKKLLRRRLILGPVVGVSGLAAVVPISLRIGGWWIAVSLAAMAIVFIAGAGLVATERSTDLGRFDAILPPERRQSIAWARRRRGWASSAFFIVLLVLGTTDWLDPKSPAPVVLALGGAGCGLWAAWLLRREVGAIRAAGGL